MMLKTGIKVAQDYTVLNYRPPRTHNNVKPKIKLSCQGPGLIWNHNVFSQGTTRKKLGRKSTQIYCSWIT